MTKYTQKALREMVRNNVAVNITNGTNETRKEIEMGIDDAEKCSQIFEEIGFKKVRTVRKNRQYYTYKNKLLKYMHIFLKK